MNNILQKIIDYKTQELEHQKRKVSLRDIRLKAEDAEPTRGFLDALIKTIGGRSPSRESSRQIGITDGGHGGRAGSPPAIIAEVKKASPSAGLIRPDFDPIKIASIYYENGASCLSVLTDEHFFQGSLPYLEKIRRAVPLPLLRKDFTLDQYHIYEARAHGADAVLLIVRILEEAQLKDYFSLAKELGLSVLVEVHNEKEMERAQKIKADLIGINNRDLDTLKIDLETTVRLSQKATKDCLLVSESGISTPEQILKLKTAGVSVFLIGESLLREKDPGKKLGELLI